MMPWLWALMFEIRELRHLLSIDEFRHLGRASKAVGLSQPALYDRIPSAIASELIAEITNRAAEKSG